MSEQDRIEWSLLSLRIGVFIVMAIWTLDKFINPGHASAVYESFYFIPKETAASFMLLFAAIESIILLGFLAGFKKRITYGLVMLFHTVSTLSSWKIYMDPFDKMLFWAAWPMLAACIALYLMRDMDKKFTACCLCPNKKEEKTS